MTPDQILKSLMSSSKMAELWRKGMLGINPGAGYLLKTDNLIRVPYISTHLCLSGIQTVIHAHVKVNNDWERVSPTTRWSF